MHSQIGEQCIVDGIIKYVRPQECDLLNRSLLLRLWIHGLYTDWIVFTPRAEVTFDGNVTPIPYNVGEHFNSLGIIHSISSQNIPFVRCDL